jgi:hypothetical protein
MVFRVAITDALEVELTIKANKPAGEAEKEFCEWRVNIKVVFP